MLIQEHFLQQQPKVNVCPGKTSDFMIESTRSQVQRESGEKRAKELNTNVMAAQFSAPVLVPVPVSESVREQHKQQNEAKNCGRFSRSALLLWINVVSSCVRLCLRLPESHTVSRQDCCRL